MKNLKAKVGIVSAKRLPIGKINGIYADETPEELGASLINAQFNQLKELSLQQVDQVILGNVTNQGGNIARRVAIAAGIPVSTPAYTVDAQCASGLVSVVSGAQTIMNGDANLVITGGVESTSQSYITLDAKSNKILKRFPMVPKGHIDLDMGVIAENMSQQYSISREQQDEYAFWSHQKAKIAFEKQLIRREILAFSKNKLHYTQDQCPRFDTSMDKLSQLNSVFKENGSVTAGNSCPINDGAATVVIKKIESGDTMQGYYLGHTIVGINPEEFMLAPIKATQKLLKKYALNMKDIDFVELNEAFAVQSILCQERLKIQPKQLNPLGGALAYGHPYGATGGIMVARLLNSLNNQSKPALGIVTLCVAGGMGMSVLIGNKYWQ